MSHPNRFNDDLLTKKAYFFRVVANANKKDLFIKISLWNAQGIKVFERKEICLYSKAACSNLLINVELSYFRISIYNKRKFHHRNPFANEVKWKASWYLVITFYCHITTRFHYLFTGAFAYLPWLKFEFFFAGDNKTCCGSGKEKVVKKIVFYFYVFQFLCLTWIF